MAEENEAPRQVRKKIKVGTPGTAKKKSIVAKKSALKEPVLPTESGDLKTDKQAFFDPNLAKTKLRVYFVCTLVLGSLLIMFPLFSGTNQILIAVGLMAAYWLLGLKYIKYPNTRAVFADSMYYLGFLFTFVALVAAMMKLGEVSKIDVIVAQMGPALITTVVGMAFRIYLTQFDAITSEPETEAFQSLGMLSSNLITALDRINETTEENRQAIEDLQRRSASQMVDFASRLDGIDVNTVATRFQGLAETIENLQITAQELRDKVERSRITTGDIEANFNDLRRSADRVANQLNNVQNFEADLNSLNDAVSRTGERFQTFSDRLENRVGASATEINSSVVTLASSLSSTEEEIRQLKEALKSALSDVIDFLNRQR